jgi:cellulose synthase/poly-beta-1,6-N-acetylglucosamine synthase-like glycosyltransferase
MMELLTAFNVFILVYFALLNGTYLILSLTAFRSLRRYTDRLESLQIDDLLASSGGLPISLVVPAFNEAATIVPSVRSLLTLMYADYEIVVVNDGSTDETLEVLLAAFDLEPIVRVPTSDLPTAPVHAAYQGVRHQNLVVVDKANGGKADALNVGLNYSRSALFCAMDADTILEPDALARVVRPFLEDASTVAVGGIVRIANGCSIDGGSVDDVKLPDSVLVRFQVLEYLRSFLSARVGWNTIGATLIISGAFGAFRRSVVADAGGFDTGTVGEDMELIVRLHRHCRDLGNPYRIEFIPDPVAWTEAPETVSQLGRQRDRWQRGLAQVIWRHRRMVMNPKYGVPGVVALPYYLVFELLGPVIELLGYAAFVVAVITGQASAVYTVAFLAIAVFLGSAISISAVALEEISFRRYRRFSDLLALLGVALAESFGYRQMSIWWRLRGLVAAARSDLQWGAMERRGLERSAGQVDDPTDRDEAATEREVPARAADAEVEIIVTDHDVVAEQTVPK